MILISYASQGLTTTKVYQIDETCFWVVTTTSKDVFQKSLPGPLGLPIIPDLL